MPLVSHLAIDSLVSALGPTHVSSCRQSHVLLMAVDQHRLLFLQGCVMDVTGCTVYSVGQAYVWRAKLHTVYVGEAVKGHGVCVSACCAYRPVTCCMLLCSQIANTMHTAALTHIYKVQIFIEVRAAYCYAH